MADNEEREESTVRGKMADNEEGEESTARGNGWEVVQLTASTYAAAPGPGGIELSNEDQSDTYDLGGLTHFGESPAIPGLEEPSEQGLGFSEDIMQSPRSQKDDKLDVSRLPCGAWWKRRAASLYSHAKEANAVWSIFVAAAVMGLVLLGQRWQNERWLALQQKWLLSVNDQKTGRMIGPISRLKDVIVSSHRRGSFIGSGSSSVR